MSFGRLYFRKKSIYIGLMSSTLSMQLSMHHSDICSITQHLKIQFCPTTEFRKTLPETQQYWNNRLTNKVYKFSKLFILGTNILISIKLILKPVVSYLNVFSYYCHIYNKRKRINKTPYCTFFWWCPEKGTKVLGNQLYTENMFANSSLISKQINVEWRGLGQKYEKNVCNI